MKLLRVASKADGGAYVGRSDYVHRVRSNPNVDLLESLLESFLELRKENPMLRQVGHIDEESG